MISFKQFIKENSINLSPDEEEQIIRMYHDGVKKKKETGEPFNLHMFSEKIGINHQTLRRKLLTRRKFNEITGRIKEKDPNFKPQELRFGSGDRDKTPHFGSSQMYKALRKAYDAKELSIAEIKRRYPGVSNKTVKLRLGLKDK